MYLKKQIKNEKLFDLVFFCSTFFWDFLNFFVEYILSNVHMFNHDTKFEYKEMKNAWDTDYTNQKPPKYF